MHCFLQQIMIRPHTENTNSLNRALFISKKQWDEDVLKIHQSLSFFLKGKCTKRPMSTFGCTFSAFFGFWVFFLWSPLGNYEKKSCVSSDLSARFKRPQKNKLMLRVSLKLLKNWRNGSQMCSSAFLCISPFKNFRISPKFFFRFTIHKKLNKSCSLEKYFLFLKKNFVSLKKNTFKRGNALKGRWAHLAAVSSIFEQL